MSEKPPKSPRKGKYVNIRIAFLNATVHVFQVPVKGVGALLWDAVVTHLHLLEADYFDLEYTNQHGDDCWLDKDKLVLKQIGSADTALRFCVKFYTPDPGLLEDELTRYLFGLQVRKDLLRGELRCSENTAALLASYVVQGESGDFDAEECLDPTYLADFKFVPHHLQTHDFLSKVMDYHRQHVGESASECDVNLLDTARKVELYGIKMHSAKDHEGVSLNLAVAHLGVLVFQHYTKINTFSWAKVRKLSFKRKKFLIKLHADTYGYYKDTVEFFFDSRDRCKLFWKRCIEHHAFFRCQQVAKLPRNKTRMVSRGSSFRYCGRTQKQLVEFVRENINKRPHFERSTSGRISSRSASVTPKVLSRPGTQHSSSADLHTSSGSRSSGSHIILASRSGGGVAETADVHSDSSMSGSRSLNSPRLEHGLSLDQEVVDAVNARTEGARATDDDDDDDNAVNRNHQHHQHSNNILASGDDGFNSGSVGRRGQPGAMVHVASETKVSAGAISALSRKASAPVFGEFGPEDQEHHLARSSEIENIPEVVEDTPPHLVPKSLSPPHSPPRKHQHHHHQGLLPRQISQRSDFSEDLPPPPPSPPPLSSPSPPPPPPPFEDNDLGPLPPPLEGENYPHEQDNINIDISDNLNTAAPSTLPADISTTTAIADYNEEEKDVDRNGQSIPPPSEPDPIGEHYNDNSSHQHHHHQHDHSEERGLRLHSTDGEVEDAGRPEDDDVEVVAAGEGDSFSRDNSLDTGTTAQGEVSMADLSFRGEAHVSASETMETNGQDQQGMSSPVVMRAVSEVSCTSGQEDEHRKRGRHRPTDTAYYIAKELLMTERTYKKDLELLCVWFRNAVSGDPATHATVHDLLFQHLDPIYNFHYAFLKDVEQRLAAWEGKAQPHTNNGECQKIGDVMLKAINNLQEIYETYLGHLEETLTELENRVKRQRPFEELCRGFESQKVCYLPLNSFLLRPGQRLLHLKLILERLVKHYCFTHHDTEDCKEALCRVTEIIDGVQEDFAKVENLEKLMELQRDLLGMDSLVHPDREFVREGCLQKFSRKGYQQRMFFLFSDMLVYTSRTSASLLQFKVHGQLPLRGMTVEETDQSKSSVQNSFAIYAGNKYILVAASSAEEKDKWMEDIADTVQRAKQMSSDKLQYPSLKSSASSSENVGGSGSGENVNHEGDKASHQGQQQRANTTMHVCWHRNTSLSMRDHQLALKNQLSGYLLRKFKTSNGWQKLWVVFTNFCLFFYKTYLDDVPLASLPLLGYAVSEPSPEDGINKEHVFKLQFKNHVYFFRAESQYTFSRWMEVINSATHNARRMRLFSRLDSRLETS